MFCQNFDIKLRNRWKILSTLSLLFQAATIDSDQQLRERIDTRPVIPDEGSTRILSATEVKNYQMEKTGPKICQFCRAPSEQKRIGD